MGIWQLLFGQTTAETHITNVVNITTQVVTQTLQSCVNQQHVMQLVNLGPGCHIDGSFIMEHAESIGDLDCIQRAKQDVDVETETELQIAQSAQALAQGLGLSTSQTKTVVDQSVTLSSTIISQISQQLDQTGTIVQSFGCYDAELNRSFVDFDAFIKLGGAGIQDADQVVKARTQLTQTIDQYAKATGKDFFAYLGQIGIIGIVAVAIIAGAFLLGIGGAAKGATTMLGSPGLWLGLCAGWGVIDGLLYSKGIWPYKDVTPLDDGSPDEATAAANRSTLLMTLSPVGIIGIGVLIWAVMRSKSAGVKGAKGGKGARKHTARLGKH